MHGRTLSVEICMNRLSRLRFSSEFYSRDTFLRGIFRVLCVEEACFLQGHGFLKIFGGEPFSEALDHPPHHKPASIPKADNIIIVHIVKREV